MPEEGFLKRWSRLKATGGETETPVRPAPSAPAAPPAPAAPVPITVQAEAPLQVRPPPTLADAARLTPDADFSSFVGKDVDKSVQRLALKKLFADPHFHVMDGLDMYMDDYNKPSPVSAAMLAALDHARSALRYPDAEKPAAEAAPAAAGHDPEAGADAGPDAGAKRVGVASADADNVLDTEVQDVDAVSVPAAVPAAVPAPAPTAQVSPPATPQQSLQGQA